MEEKQHQDPPPLPPPAPAQRFIINSHDAGSSLDSQNVPPKQGPDDHVCAAINAEARILKDHSYKYRITNALH